MLVLSATIGIPMGIFYPFPLLSKIYMLVGLVFALALMIYGFKRREKVSGQVIAVVGYCIWSFIGLLGLGTGT